MEEEVREEDVQVEREGPDVDKVVMEVEEDQVVVVEEDQVLVVEEGVEEA